MENWFADKIKNYDGYPIGKTLSYITDPKIISLAGGLPSPDVFQTSEFRTVSEKILSNDIDKIMQYSAIPGEQILLMQSLAF